MELTLCSLEIDRVQSGVVQNCPSTDDSTLHLRHLIFPVHT